MLIKFPYLDLCHIQPYKLTGSYKCFINNLFKVWIRPPFSSKTYVVGTQKNGLVSFEHPKHVFKLVGKKIITILRS